MEKPWSLPSQRLITQYQTNAHHGLGVAEARRRLASHGRNELKGTASIGAAKILARQFNSPLIYILVMAAALSYYRAETADAIVILFVVVANALIGFFQEYRAEQTMSKLRQILTPQARVIRDSVTQKIAAAVLVPGDIVLLEAGDRVPADLRVIESQTLRINQASLTGESVPVVKHDSLLSPSTELIDRTNMAYLSTLVVSGKGVGVVVATGMKTELGEIAREVTTTQDTASVITKQIGVLGRYLLLGALVLSALVLVVGIGQSVPALEMLRTTVSLLVSMVPEGLPVALTVVLSVGLARIYQHRAIVRTLSAAETLGSATVIAVDKTGTITEGVMMVEKFVVAGQEYSVDGHGYGLSGHFYTNGERVEIAKRKEARLMLELSALATMSTINKKDLLNDEARLLSDPTETALAVVAAKAGFYAFKQEQEHPEILEIPFNQELRYSTSVHKFGRFNRYITKGAVEKIISMSERIVGEGGAERRLLTASKTALEEQAAAYAAKGLRVTAIGYADTPASEAVKTNAVPPLTFVGLICMADPIRRESRAAVERAQQAGVRVIMLTGDHILTATTIAQQIGLMEEGDQATAGKVLHGADVRGDAIEQLKVVARATPKDKLMIIQRLQERGEIVAMTGDGVNDAPALKKADIGIAMGRAGTDVAIEAADMVLLNDNFAAIVHAIEQGRLIWENLRKVIFYLVSTSIAEALVIILALQFKFPLPLLAVQILWMNLATDGVTSLSLTMEKPEENLMAKPPRSPKATLLHWADTRRIFLLTVVMAIGTLVLYKLTLPQGEAYARTVALTAMVFFQLFNLLNCRSAISSVFTNWTRSNPVLYLTLALALALQLLAIYHPLAQRYLHTVALDGPMLALIASFALSIIVIDEIRKLVVRLAHSWALRHASSV